MNKISDDIIWRYLQGTATTEDMKALNEYISASPENKKYLFSIEELYHLGKWKYDEEDKINAAMQRLKSVVQPVEMSVLSEKQGEKTDEAPLFVDPICSGRACAGAYRMAVL